MGHAAHPLFLTEALKRNKIEVTSVLETGSKIYHESSNSNFRALFPESVRYLGTDMQPGNGVDLVCDLEDETPLPLSDLVLCCSVLEHCRYPWLAAAKLEQSAKKALFITVPFVWRYHGYPADYYRFTPQGVKALFSKKVKWVDSFYFDMDAKKFVKEKLPPDFQEQPYFDPSREGFKMPILEVYCFGVMQ